MRAPGSTNTAAARAWAAALMGAAILAWTGILVGVPFVAMFFALSRAIANYHVIR